MDKKLAAKAQKAKKVLRFVFSSSFFACEPLVRFAFAVKFFVPLAGSYQWF
jgi:hypothetical protein